MKIDFNQSLLGFDGEPLLNDKGEPFTLKAASLLALNVALPGDQDYGVMDKIQLGMLGMSIVQGKEITTEDAAKLKARICKVLPAPVVAVAVQNAIEGSTQTANEGGASGD